MPEVDAETQKLLWQILQARNDFMRSDAPAKEAQPLIRRGSFDPEKLAKRIRQDKKLPEKVIPWLLKMAKGGLQDRMSEAVRDTAGTRALGVLYKLGPLAQVYCRQALLEPTPLSGIEPEAVDLLHGRPDVLTEVLRKGSVAAKTAAAQALGGYPPERLRMLGAHEAAAEALNSDNARLQYVVCYLLMKVTTGPGQAIEKVEKLIWTEDADLASMAIQAYGVLAGPRGTVELLRRYASAQRRDVRQAVLRALGKGRDPMAAEFLVGRLLDADDTMRALACEALGRIGSPRAVPALIDLARGEPQTWVRLAALSALGKIGDVRALPILKEILHTERDRMGEGAVRALGDMGRPECIEPIERVLRDPEAAGRLHVAAVEALGKIPDAQAVWVLLDFLEDRGPFVPALEILKRRTGQDLGRDIEAWSKYREEFQAAMAEAKGS
jgi:HEAT repeat protein